MKKKCSEAASEFFKGMGRFSALKEHIRNSDQVIQFDPGKGDPFYVEIRQGNVDFGIGQKYPLNFEAGLYITGDQETLVSLFRGKVSLAEAIYDHKIRIPGYRKKEPLMVWFSKLLRKGRGLTD